MTRLRIAIVAFLACSLPPIAPAHPESEIAIAELTALIARAPRQPSLYLSRSNHLREHSRWSEAEADLCEAERLDPAHAGLDLAFATLFSEAGRFDAAIGRIERILLRTPRDATALILRARLRAKSGNNVAAIADYGAAIAALPEPRPELYLERAALPADPAEALAGLEEAIARIGPALVLMERALALEIQLGRNDAALRRLVALAAGSERKDFWHKRRGDLLASMGRHQDARRAYHEALDSLRGLPDWLRESPDTVRIAEELNRRVTALP